MNAHDRAPRLVLIAFAMLLAACATVDVTTTQYLGAPRYQPTEPTAVQILRTEPTAPHDRLGEIMVEASTEPAPPITEIEQKVCKAAAKLGADAVVVVFDRIQPVGAYLSGPWWGRSVETVSGRKLIAVAIRYKR
jgi:energy-converting hydrogenase Eha subunit F